MTDRWKTLVHTHSSGLLRALSVMKNTLCMLTPYATSSSHLLLLIIIYACHLVAAGTAAVLLVCVTTLSNCEVL